MRAKAPEGMTSFSYNGVTYTVGEDGFVDVPESVLSALRPHGLVPAPAPVEEKKEEVKETASDEAASEDEGKKTKGKPHLNRSE